MSALSLKFLKAGPPPPRVVLLPDALFFVRAVPVSVDPAADALRQSAEAASQVELALEALAPFPVAQLYHGHHWVPGSDRALAFAAYRRRFTPEQSAEWADAELMLPAFACILGAEVTPATTVVLASPEGFTAVHWGVPGPVPTQVWFQSVPADAPEEDRAAARTALLRRAESKTVLDLPALPEAQPRRSDREFSFRSGELKSRISSVTAAALDVRDKADLAALRRARARDVLFWRILVGCAAAVCLLAAGEVALFGGGIWQKARRVQLSARAPLVEKIMTHQEIANHIEDLSTRRLLPIQMIEIAASKKPAATVFIRASTTGLYTLNVEAQTPNVGEIGMYKNDLEALPSCAGVVIKNPQTRDNLATFTLFVSFKPDALKAPPPPP